MAHIPGQNPPNEKLLRIKISPPMRPNKTSGGQRPSNVLDEKSQLRILLLYTNEYEQYRSNIQSAGSNPKSETLILYLHGVSHSKNSFILASSFKLVFQLSISFSQFDFQNHQILHYIMQQWFWQSNDFKKCYQTNSIWLDVPISEDSCEVVIFIERSVVSEEWCINLRCVNLQYCKFMCIIQLSF